MLSLHLQDHVSDSLCVCVRVFPLASQRSCVKRATENVLGPQQILPPKAVSFACTSASENTLHCKTLNQRPFVFSEPGGLAVYAELREHAMIIDYLRSHNASFRDGTGIRK